MSQIRFGGGAPTQSLLAFIIGWAIVAVAVWAAASLVDGIDVTGWESLAIVALIIGLLNALLRPVIFALAFPFMLVTLGLFGLLLSVAINAGLLWVADRIADDQARLLFSVQSFFWDAVLGGVIISVVAWALNIVFNPRRVSRRMF